MRTRIAVLALIVLSPLTALAGGDSFRAEIVSLTSTGNDEYRLELIQHTAPYGSKGKGLPAQIIVHLRFNQPMFTPNPPFYASKQKYLEAIDSLKKQAEKGGEFPFGIMSEGYEPVKGRKNEFQSNALCILRQIDGQKVVYSFAKRV